MRPAGRRSALLLAAVGFTLVGCAGTAEAPTTSTGDPVGSWGTPGERSAHLILEADGAYLGNDGCNGFSGTWSQADATAPIEFSDGVMSLIFCDGVDQWLTAKRSAIVDGDTIYVLDEGGDTIGSLPRN